MTVSKKATSSSSKNLITYSDVFVFVPNLIGYTRVFLTAVAVYSMYSEHPHMMVLSYAISELLDAADGYYARKLNQCSKFGEVLDMVTDRCTTVCLMTYLTKLYPSLSMIICFLISLDISSHYMQMYASLASGNSNHKQMDENAHPILKAYYTKRIVLFWVCFGNETFFILSYYVKYLSGFSYYLTFTMLIVSFPVFALKNTINGIQLYEASKQLAKGDADALNKST
ncbi:hypothetical protein BB559_000785 [Furculomyces boomerangus]|uniref:CDP-diacylglycerol--inositol 3-phosphatidyltransferase n=2 Tax=Harpellales TaxID=61421 RepID=A0A2T9Z436_9FUNG|nr:hypothetical protein BB559_000785 [Furculomyces boomerangus]PWA02574.1 hypothetical protein BB558_001286 [Smittium angustum]